MALAEEYARQLRWRAWDVVLAALPEMANSVVFDLGCAIGDQAALLTARGAAVVGFDANEDLVAVARARAIPRATFIHADLRRIESGADSADGLWCSFAAAYIPNLTSVLESWRHCLRPGGWLALIEIDDLFGHGPLSPTARDLLDRFADEALEAGRYDYRMGRKLEEHAARAGFEITRSFAVPDAELSFDGPAAPDVVLAWRQRFDRLPGLRSLCGAQFDELRDEFLLALENDDHRATARVRCVIAKHGGRSGASGRA
jgi:SAM-dependent methyltransferase